MNEFELIRRYFQRGALPDWCPIGIGDDAAMLRPPAGEALLICTDTLIAGRHFPLETAPADIGWKALGVNLSDLAAMGGKPLGFLLNLTLPEADETFIAAFAQGLFAMADQAGVALIGGDTTRGPLSISITALGSVVEGHALRRDGARVGDHVAIVGDLGGAALALEQGRAASSHLRQALDRPWPQLQAGQALAGQAHAAIDVSDGLAADLGHILEASGVGAELHLEDLPLHPELHVLAPEQARRLALYGGDDYALCVCLNDAALMHYRQRCAVPIQVIGRIVEGAGLYCRDDDGDLQPLSPQGYRHF